MVTTELLFREKHVHAAGCAKEDMGWLRNPTWRCCFILVLAIFFHNAKGYHYHNPSSSSGHHQNHHHQPPRITEHPVDTVVAKHDPATLKCEAAGQPPPTITWYKEGAPVKANQHRVLLPNGGLFFLRVAHGRKENDSGEYWCEASNALGKARSRNATLTVAVLREDFRLEPQSARVSVGEDVILECQPPKGSPEPRVTWRKDGKPLIVEGRLNLVDGNSLAISQASVNDDGRYQCVATNAAGERESAIAVLTVYVKPFMIRPPVDVTALVDGTVEFSCEVGGDPVPDVLWRRIASGGTMPLGRVRVLEDRTLRLERVTLADQGVYTCDADNFAGAISASAHLTVLAPPTFSTRPSAQTVEVGQPVSFRCKSEGSPTPFLYWAIEGDRALLYPGSNEGGFEVIDNDGVSTLILKEAQIQSSGTVVICSAVNSAGSVSTRTRLTVTSKEDRPPPMIVLGPVNQTLPIGSLAVITCKAEGNPAPFISWYKGGVPVSSSTRLNMTISTHLTITNLQEEDSGPYTCVASSRFGKAVWTGYLLVADPKNPNINFFKAPEPSMLPEAPGRPHALNQSEGSVTITWNSNKKMSSTRFFDYQIELFGREENVTPTWTVVGRHVLGPTFTQHLLSTGVPYTFLVRARNEHGLGPPSQLSEPIVVGPDSTQNWGNPEVTILSEARAVLMTSNIVRLTEGIAVSSTAIKVSWMITDSTYVEGLYIYYISLNSDSSNPKGYSMLTVLHTGGSSSFTVNNLEKWSSYQFFIVPFFKNVEGYPSNSKTIKTLEDVPSEPPSHMEALLLNSTAVFLKWRPPEHAINGDLQGYKVDVRTNGTDIVKSLSVGKAPNLLLNNLTAGVSYFVKVAAFNKAGTGPYNAEATLRLEPVSRIADNTIRPLDQHPSGDFITETWFMALLVSMVSVMVFLFVAMMLVRRRQLANGKKGLTSRTNGHVLKGDCTSPQPPPLWLDKSTVPEYTLTAADRGTPLPDYAKACAGMRGNSRSLNNGSVPEYHGSINLQTNPLYKEFSRPDSLHYSSEKYYPITRKYKDYSCLQVQEYASPNLHPEKTIADYAEVNPSANQSRANGGNTSPAPYATTTLVTGTKKTPWTNFPQSSSAGAEEDPPYPSLNGGYYNRKVYSDSYFSPTHTLRRPKRDRDRNSHPSEPLSPSSTNGSVYARVGPPTSVTNNSWANSNGSVPSMSSFAPPFPPPPAPLSIYQGARSEPGNIL